MLQIDRRTVIGTALGAATGIMAGPGAFAATSVRRPNFLFIMADDMGYADAGCFGSRENRTPNIDRLAAQGIRLTDGYANSSVCSPTRLALHTGCYQNRFPAGVSEPFNPGPWGDQAIPAGQPTMQGELRKAGYSTHLVGKWHLGDVPGAVPLAHGYDTHYGILGGSVDYFTHESRSAEHALQRDGEVIDDAGYLTQLFAREAVRRIGICAGEDQPFLLSLHFNAPHWPWEGPEDFGQGTQFSNYETGSLRIYQEMVESMDSAIGDVLRALDEAGLAQDTFVVFTSDNGGERFSDAWPFRGMKTELLEGGIRVPTVVRYPGLLPAGVDSAQTAISMDWMPTFLDAAGADYSGLDLDGVSLMPMLQSGARQDRDLFWRLQGHRQRAFRHGAWKYFSLDGHEFLFNLADDPHERANRAEAEPERLAAMRDRWIAWNDTMVGDPDTPGICFDADQMAQPLASGPEYNCKT